MSAAGFPPSVSAKAAHAEGNHRWRVVMDDGSMMSLQVTNSRATARDMRYRFVLRSCRTLTWPIASTMPRSARMRYAATRSWMSLGSAGPAEVGIPFGGVACASMNKVPARAMVDAVIRERRVALRLSSLASLTLSPLDRDCAADLTVWPVKRKQRHNIVAQVDRFVNSYGMPSECPHRTFGGLDRPCKQRVLRRRRVAGQHHGPPRQLTEIRFARKPGAHGGGRHHLHNMPLVSRTAL